jgi:hypothetical protein
VWKLAVIVFVALALGGLVVYNATATSENTVEQKLRQQLTKERETNEQVQGKMRQELRRLRLYAAPILRPTPAGNRLLAQRYFGDEYPCAAEIIEGETAGTWDHTIWNYEGSGAYGLGQARPRDKMLPYSYADLHAYTNPMPQLVWFKAYAEQRYGSVCGAAAHWTPRGSW